MTVPRLAGFSMPPEWAPHARTWMELPGAGYTFGADATLDRFRRAWAEVANTIARFEPVSMICNVGDLPVARDLLDSSIDVHETPTDDAWFRDSGPTFLTAPDGRLGATHWRFNGWGKGAQRGYEAEAHVGALAAELAGATLFSSSMVNEGGGIHVDGEGTVLVTTTVQLDPARNPGWDTERVEAELRAYLGVEHVIWVPRGLTRDYDDLGTLGHIDIVAAFARPGVLLVHVQTDPTHPDFEVSRAHLELFRSATDARGERFEVIEVPAPRTTFVDDEPVDWSYINHYVCNGAVILCGFDDERDDEAREILRHAHPDREIVQVDARAIFECGGGIHCITQQQPAV